MKFDAPTFIQVSPPVYPDVTYVRKCTRLSPLFKLSIIYFSFVASIIVRRKGRSLDTRIQNGMIKNSCSNCSALEVYFLHTGCVVSFNDFIWCVTSSDPILQTYSHVNGLIFMINQTTARGKNALSLTNVCYSNITSNAHIQAKLTGLEKKNF